jgi:CRISPR/Cas system-associated exonuclease Cas4 (RecB family)
MSKQLPYLSKSKYLDGQRCPKLLWYKYNRKQAIPPFGVDILEIMKQGAIVGELAQKLFPGGIKIEREGNPDAMAKRSLAGLEKRKPLFEGGFIFKQAYAIADILVPVEGENPSAAWRYGAWDLIEVKSTASIKDEHYYDAAFQKYVFEGNGIKIRHCYLMHINKDYVRSGELELDKLFKKGDVTVEVLERLSAIEKDVEAMMKVIAGEEPQVKIGPQCRDCPLEDLCWKFLPEYNVFMLRGNKEVAYDLAEKGFLKIDDIPLDYQLNEKQRAQVQSHRTNEPYVDRDALRSFLSEIKYPVYFLDFETIAAAVPIYDNTHPYEDVPVQFSLHVIEKEGAGVIHHSYLAPGNIDPRPEILRRLKELLGDAGSIVAYFADYEKKCIRSAVKAYPEYAEWFVKLKDRFIDLLLPFKNLYYYHPQQKGSASIKDVLPALTGVSYNGLEINNGAAATFEYLRVTFNEKVDEKEKDRVRQALEKYCGLDTLGMVKILEVLREAAK